MLAIPVGTGGSSNLFLGISTVDAGPGSGTPGRP